MSVLSSNDIRSSFIEFFKDKGHTFAASSPVVPLDDPTLLFANAGMNQFKDVFLGTGSRLYTRAVNSQKCIRAGGKHNDLEDVGNDTYHHTFFEMLGNWSLGDYFKEDAIRWAWQLITEVWGIDKSKLYATVFEGDKKDGLEPDSEATNLWKKVTDIAHDHILAFDKKDNFWEMGETGPCGPCSEIHIDLGDEHCDMKHIAAHKCAVNAGCARFIELWNLVFIQFNRTADGSVVKLPAQHIDTGLGLERVAAVLQNKTSNYDTDLFTPIMLAIEKLSGLKYTSILTDKKDVAFRVISDHIRALSFAIADGGTPSNEGRGYVLRRILRRACRFGRVLNLHKPFMHKLVDTVVKNMAHAFPELKQRQQLVETVIEAEEKSFGRTLDRGLQIFETAAAKAQKNNNKTISGEDAFALYDTFGFPVDLTALMAKEQGLSIDQQKFKNLMQQQRDRARAAKKANAIALVTDVELPTTCDHFKYSDDKMEASVIGWITTDGYITKGKLDNSAKQVGLILNKTCFYGESGGQTGDVGTINSDTGTFKVETTEKLADCIIHKGIVTDGQISPSQTVTATVEKSRLASKRNHTATHLLQWALQKVLGETVAQQGSFVNPSYLRFDFTYPKAMTAGQINEVEKFIAKKIADSLEITTKDMPIKQAKKLGATALFNEKYGDTVRVVAIGSDNGDIAPAFSKEFCGGTHCKNTAEIAGCKIIKEESVSAGIRRITALTGSPLFDYLSERSDTVEKLISLLKTPAEQINERVEKLIKDNKQLAKELKTRPKAGSVDPLAKARELLANADKSGDSSIIIGSLPDTSIDEARQAIDMLKKKAASATIVLGIPEQDKVMLLVGVTDDLVKKGIKAGDIIKQIAPIVGGGGGGRPQLAQAGGKNPEKLDDCLAKAKEVITALLS